MLKNSCQTHEILNRIRCFVLDMDGTIYLGNDLFDFTIPFLENVKKSGRDFYFFTNNSSKNKEAYIEKLAQMQILIPAEKMLISNQVIIQWLLKEHPGKSVYIVGTPYLVEDFKKAGICVTEDADIVILGFDTTLTYEKLVIACNLVRAGKPIFGANPDFNCPVEGGGFIPDCGSMARLIEASTGVLPEFFGKPSRHTLDYIIKTTGYAPWELAVVGDRLYTDIAVAEGTDVTSILVLSGETKLQDLEKSPIQPDLIFQNLSEMIPLL